MEIKRFVADRRGSKVFDVHDWPNYFTYDAIARETFYRSRHLSPFKPHRQSRST